MAPTTSTSGKASLSPLPSSSFSDQLASLALATSSLSAKSLADSLVQSFKSSPNQTHAECFEAAHIPHVVKVWSESKQPGERESAGILVERLAKGLGEGSEGLLLGCIPDLLNILMDKTQSIRTSAQGGVNAIIKTSAPEGTRQIMSILKTILDETKGWRTKVGALKAMEGLVKSGAEDWVAEELGGVIPVVEHAMHDTKSEVSPPGRRQTVPMIEFTR